MSGMLMQCSTCFERFTGLHMCKQMPLPGAQSAQEQVDYTRLKQAQTGARLAELSRLRGDRRFQAACAAMQTIMGPHWKARTPDQTAREAVAYADALLAELEKEPGR